MSGTAKASASGRELAGAGFYSGNFWTEQENIRMAALIDSHLEPLLRAMESVWAGVPDKLRAQLDDERLVPMDVASIPVLYATLRQIRVEAEKWRPGR